MTVLFARLGRPARPTVFVFAVALLLAACGGGRDQAAGDATTPEPRETAAPPGASTETERGGQESRTVAHEFGEAEVPADPQRVVVLDDDSILGTALLLDVPVVATTFQPFGPGFLPYFPAEAFSGMEDLGWPEIDVEKLAAVQPDLIIGDTGKVDEDLYPLLEQIAPTVVFEHFGDTPWKDAIREAAAVFGGEQEIEQGIAAYEARVAELRAVLGDRVDELTVSLANFRALDDIRIYTDQWCSGRILAEVGFARPPNQQFEETEQLSIERLPEVDADVLFYFVGSTATDPEEAGEAEAAISSHPLWGNLAAVQAGRAYRVDVPHWFTCSSLQASNLVLDDLFRLLVEGAS